MTLEECRTSTALLGFSESLQELDDMAESAFRAAVNRAIWEVDAIRPRTGVITLSHYPPVNHLARSDFFHYAGTEDTLLALGDAYCFTVTGSGRCVISNGYRVIEHTWEGKTTPTVFRGFLSGVIEMRFTGDSGYHVKGAAIYGKEDFVTTEDIPPAEAYKTYDIRTYAPDAIAMVGAPERLVEGVLYPMEQGYRLNNRCELELPTKERGEYRITYRRTPPQVRIDTDYDTEILLDEDLCQLLPLQIAYYLLLDNDATAAAAYLTQYREGVYRIRSAERARGNSLCYSTNGW